MKKFAPRSEVRQVVCPACGAKPYKKCTGVREKIRESNHQERVDAYIEQIEEQEAR